MAYMSQDKKKALAPNIKAICKRHGIKATLGVRHYSTLVLNISEGVIDFFGDRNPEAWSEERLNEPTTYLDVNPYHWRGAYNGKALAFFSELFPAMNEGNHDHSDSMTDYFDVGWYVEVNVGQYNKPYRLTGTPTPKVDPKKWPSVAAFDRGAIVIPF